jgi:hypothetical protein
MTFKDVITQLSPLETFDPMAFQGDDKTPQKLCDFILALALAYNDLRDSIFAQMLLADVAIANDNLRTPEYALRNGLFMTALRLQVGFTRELLALVEENIDVIHEPSFKKILQKLSSGGKKAWSSIQTVACDKPANDSLSKALIIIRNKVAFHYDATQIGNAYKLAFLQNTEYGEPLLSRGSSMRGTRFYFPDAVTQQYIKQKTNENIFIDFIEGKGTLILSINQALFELITKFINSRSTWRKHKGNP